ncbi:hypothetical protein AB0M12_11105 [Nocardia vinacea]|uniref:WXG100 family type VII secretion target n=1 Tax=Nocardia vinacea TaxID=96468 RepID=UPI003427AEB8
MAEQFYADPAALRARAPEHERIAADVAATVQTLRKALSAEGTPWGDDDAGRAFAQSYLPEHKQTMDDLDSLVEVLRQSGSDLRQLANNLEDIDLLGARSVSNTGNETQNGAGPTTVGNGTDAQSTDNNAGTERTATQPSAAATFAPNAVPPIDQTSAAATRPTGTHSTDIGTPAASDGASSSPQRSDDTSGSRPDRDQPGSNQSGTDQPAAGSAGSPAAGVQPVAQADVGRTRPAADSRTVAGGSPAAGRTPWSKTGAPGTPWSKPTTRPPRVSAPDAGRQDAPPRIPGRPAPARATGKGEDPNRKTAQPNSGESLAARLARELAERYGVQAFGFDTPGVPEVVLTEIVSAVDTVLPQYPQVNLQAIGIDELPDGEPARLEWDSASQTSRIVLAMHAATDPEQTAAPGYAQRPVYASIVRELGAALDAAGGFRARTAAQRALLTAYLPQAREDRGSLNRTVSGFRTWRAQLSARSFHREQLDPAAALAEAFTDVVLNANRATPPAQVLHSLLVRTAGSDQASMSRWG